MTTKREAWRQYATAMASVYYAYPGNLGRAVDAMLAEEVERFGPFESAEHTANDVRTLEERVRVLTVERDEARAHAVKGSNAELKELHVDATEMLSDVKYLSAQLQTARRERREAVEKAEDLEERQHGMASRVELKELLAKWQDSVESLTVQQCSEDLHALCVLIEQRYNDAMRPF